MPRFLPVPVDGREAKCHDETVRRYQVQIDGSEVSCQDEIVLVTSKKQGTSASADSANDAVPVDETVRVTQDLINGKEFKGIELGIDTNLSWRWRRHLIKPSVLCGRSNLTIFLLKGIHYFFSIIVQSIHLIASSFASSFIAISSGIICLP